MKLNPITCLLASVCTIALGSGPAFAQETATAASLGSTAPGAPPTAALQDDTAGQASDRGERVSDQQVGDIIVTAQRRAESLQRVPVAVTALSASALEDRHLNEIGELRATVPGLQMGGGDGKVQPFLRGIGNAATAVGNESSVAVYIDGVYYTTAATGFFSLNNIERVEVLKGPQGTLFGRNSSGGVIQLVTKDPSTQAAAQAELSYGNYNTVIGSLYATTGLAENLAIDLSVNGRRQGDGYGRNITTGNRNAYNDYFSARSKLLFTPGENTRLTLTGLYGYSKASIQANTFPGTTQGFYTPPFDLVRPYGFYNRADDIDSFTDYEQYGVTFRVEQELPFAQLTSTTAYLHNTSNSSVDADWGPRPDFYVRQKASIKQFTQEFQLSSQSTGPFVWTAGLFYYRTRQSYDDVSFQGTPTLFGPAGLFTAASQLARSYALYGQATYEIAPHLRLTGGLRYTWDKTSADGILTTNVAPRVTLVPSNPQSVKYEKLTFKAAIDYQFTDTILGYSSFSRGFKSQAFNLLVYDPTPNKPEVIDSYEIGLKSDLFDRRLRLNLAAFHYDVRNPQVQLIRAGSVILSNANSAKVNGAEAEVTAALFRGFTARASVAYLDSKYKDYGNIDSTGACVGCAPSAPIVFTPPYGAQAPAISIIADGNRTSRAPKWSGDVGFDYVADAFGGEVGLTADYYFTSAFFYEPDNILRQGRYGLLSAQLRYSPIKSLDLSLFGKNLTNKKYTTFAATQSGPSGYPYNAGPPRTYGVTARVRF